MPRGDSHPSGEATEIIPASGWAPRLGAFGPAAQSGEVGVLGSYRLIKELGRGGMGAVYAAVDTRTGRHIAVKTMLAEHAADPTARERFLREARITAMIHHDNVVAVYEADEWNGTPFIAMQFLKGAPLDEYLRRYGTLSVPQIMRIGAEAAAGLSAAHRVELVHRDIKPANLWLEAPSGRVKVLDFGLAKPTDTDRELTRSGMVVGTPAFMSPEQARGERVDARSDLYGLGVVLYWLCAGRLPFDGPNTMAVLTALATADPAPIRVINPHVPEAFAALIHQLLAKRAADRPSSATEVVTCLQNILDGTAPSATPVAVPVAIPVTVPADSNPFAQLEASTSSTAAPEYAEPARTGNRWVWVITAIAAVVVVAGAAALAMSNRNRAEPKPAPHEPIAQVPEPQVPTPPKPPAPANPERKAAEWVISLGGTVRVKDSERDIRAVADLPRPSSTLTAIDLDGERIPAGGLATLDGLVALAALDGLTNLSLKNTGTTDADVVHLKKLYSLKRLALAGNPLTDAGMRHLADLHRLESVDLSGTMVSDAGLVHLKGCHDLWELVIGGTRVTDAGLAHLRSVPKLGRLDLTRTGVTDAGLAHLSQTGLRNLDLSSTRVTDSGLKHLSRLTTLKHLNLFGTAVTDDGLRSLTAVPWLTALEAKKTKVTMKGVTDFRGAVPGCRIAWDGGAVEPTNVNRKAAEWVYSVGGTVGLADHGRHIPDAARLPGERFTVTTVDLSHTKVTDADLTNLRHLHDLSRLILDDTKVTDAGLAHLKGHHALKALHLHGTKVTAAGVKELAAILPRCTIHHDGRAEPKK